MTVRNYGLHPPVLPPLGGNILSAVGRLRRVVNQIIGVTDFGTYTPTLTNVANLDVSSPGITPWFRVGNMVTVFGEVDADATAGAGTLTRLRFSLPIISAIALTGNVGGAGNTNDGTTMVPVLIYGDPANDAAEFYWFAQFTTNQGIFFSFSYQIL